MGIRAPSRARIDERREVNQMLKLFTFAQVAADSLRRREEGQTMAEYGVVLAVITLPVVGSITLLSDNVPAGDRGRRGHYAWLGKSQYLRWGPLPGRGPSSQTTRKDSRDDSISPQNRHSIRAGQSLTEFALALPILALLLFAVIQFGIAFNNYVTLTDATRAGARKAALGAGRVGQRDVIVGTRSRTGFLRTTAAPVPARPHNFVERLTLLSGMSILRRAVVITGALSWCVWEWSGTL